VNRGIVALIGIVVLAAAGCGGGDGGGGDGGERLTKSQYEERIQALDKRLGSKATAFGVLINDLVNEPAKSDLDAVARATKEFQDVATEAVDEYEQINPPEEVDDLHRRLTDGTRAFVGDLDALRDEADKGNREAAAREAAKARTGDLDSIRDLAKVTQEFIDKGYDLKA